ncbi:MAG: NADH-quinone oxidoreductase subunit N [Archaeoglobaceae archaeon]
MADQVIFLISLVTLAIAAAFSYWSTRISMILSLAVLIVASLSYFKMLPTLIFLVAFLNVLSLLALKSSQLKGIDYALVSFMLLATLLIFYTSDPAMLLALFVAASAPTYILIMIGERMNIDIGVKYITFMIFGTVLFILGAALLYYNFEHRSSLIYSLAMLSLITGLAIEVGIAPAHEWVPDVFSTADPVPVSIIASLAKFVPFLVAYKVISATAVSETQQLLFLIAIIAALSMFVGNIGALTTKDPARTLGYSTVANMGYVLATFAAINAGEYVYFAIAGGILQLFVNAFGKIGFFNSIKEGTSSTCSWLLSASFIGIPPLMGFWSKFLIIYSLVFSNYLWLAILLVLNSAISVPYYVRLARITGKGWKPNITNYVVLVASLLMLITLIPPTWIVESVMQLRW